jgi:putative dimethyl sulfoxide reductase chaperone
MKNPDQAETSSDPATRAAARAQLYRLLAAIFGHEPQRDLLDGLYCETVQTLLFRSDLDLGEEFLANPPATLQNELAEEYTRLFLGPGKHISPHESVQLRRGSGTLWGEETVLVKRFIEAAGFDFEDDFNGIPDHISVELEFLAKLAEAEAEAWAADNGASANNILEWQRDFISRHAGKWMPGFCTKVAKEARLPFYRVFSKVLKAFLVGEKMAISADLQTAFPQGRDLPVP